MSPIDLVGWTIAVAVSLILAAFALGVGIAIVKAALSATGKKKGTTIEAARIDIKTGEGQK